MLDGNLSILMQINGLNGRLITAYKYNVRVLSLIFFLIFIQIK